MSREIAILGRVGAARERRSGAVIIEPPPWTPEDEEQENQIMREDG